MGTTTRSTDQSTTRTTGRTTGRTTRTRRWALVTAGLVWVAACSSDDGGTDTTGSSDPATATTDAPAALEPAPGELVALIEQAAAGGCEPLDPARCLLPFPSNGLTRADEASATGLRLALPADGMPQNASGVAIDPAEWNRNDGFSTTSPLLTHITDLDAQASELPSWTEPDASLGDDSTIVVVEVDSGERWPVFAEPDAKAGADDDQLLKIYPLIPFTEGATYAVGLRALVGLDGAPIDATAAFTAYRDRLDTGIASVEDRRESMEDEVFAPLSAAGVERSELQSAWSFTIASTDGIAGRMLHIRDNALGALGVAAPTFEVTEVVDEVDDEYIARTVRGTYTVPNYLTGDGSPGQRFFYGDGVAPTADELPVRNGDISSPFECRISDSTLAGGEPARVSQYGHGLLGSQREVGALNVRQFAFEHNIVFCATKWAGMSEDDIANAIDSLGDFSNFPTMADRLQQGVLNQIVLGRLMIADDGLATHPAFQFADGSPLIDTSHLYYDGNSQGGIMGLMLTAVSPDIERAVLGVPGMNYSMLLPRSVDFDDYELVMVPAYPDVLDRTLIISLAQQLWDRGEGAGYVQHVTTDAYTGTSTKQVLLHVALGDHQVTEISAFIAARALGAGVHQPLAAPGRASDGLAWGLDALSYPSEGSGIVLWDSGSPSIPVVGLPPRDGRDPHEDPRYDADVRRQKSEFLQVGGQIIDVCGDAPCESDIDPR
jgi:hypothetical protein